MRVYLDNCCYNRPFDDQHNLATALESFAKLQIQSLMRSGELEYVLKKVREVGGMRVANPVEFITWRADND